ncbi:MAG: Gfo/Idh/MocA family oxidoreductase [Tannerella sp.]|jgi:predicted dehydrogenase|nr:Gfo/Idh/MocA family oxidoreductase [Tannerella sp.]
MDTVRWGIIGCGDVCEVKSGPAFYKCDHSALQAVMRRDAEKAADFARRHGVPRFYSDARQLIDDPEVDIVYVATPPAGHAEWTVRALQAGKPVYVEKPMGRTYEECRQMLQAAGERHRKLWVAYYRRSLPYFLKVKELLEARAIGRVQAVRTAFFRPPLACDLEKDLHTWRVDRAIAGGGYFYDLASHTIDLLMFLLGDIVEARGIASNVGCRYEAEDTVGASFLFRSGAVGSAIMCYVSSAAAREDSTEIIGEKGSIRFSTFDFTPVEWITPEKTEKFHYPRPQHIQQQMIQSIVDEMRGAGQCPSTGETGSRVNRVMEQVFAG